MENNLLDMLRQHYYEELHVFTHPGGMGQLGSKQWGSQRDELNYRLSATRTHVQVAGRQAGE